MFQITLRNHWGTCWVTRYSRDKQISWLMKNIRILVNKIYRIRNGSSEKNAYRTRQKMKIENLLRAPKKRFMDQKVFNWCREEPPIVSGTHDLNWNRHHRKKSTCNNFSQQKLKTNPRLIYLQSVVMATWFSSTKFFFKTFWIFD